MSGTNATPIVIVAVAGAVVLVLLAWILQARRKARARQEWPTVMGKVLESRYEPITSTGETGYATAYYPIVKYEYNVDGQPYQGEEVAGSARVVASGTGGPQQETPFPAGTPIAVYYNPNKPGESALEPESPGITMTLFVIALIVMIVLLAFGLVLVTSISG